VFGGGIYNFKGTVTINASSVVTNTAINGGGIYNEKILYIFAGSNIGAAGLGNADINIEGGGLKNWSGTTTVLGSTIMHNTATWGGGIFNHDEFYILGGSVVRGNTATLSGGGIYNNTSGNLTVNDSQISANNVNNRGVVYNIADLNIQNYSVIGGIGGIGDGNCASNHGGGIYLASGEAIVVDSALMYNIASEGGGVYSAISTPGNASITYSCIQGNSSYALFNNYGVNRSATLNWWWQFTGPNSPGSDTVNTYWDTIPYLLEPPASCPHYIFIPLVVR